MSSSTACTEDLELCSRNEDAEHPVLYQDEKKKLSNHSSHNIQDCIEEGVTDLKRELKASKQAPECQLEEMLKLKATAEEDVLKLKQELHACREATECLLEQMRELTAAAEKDVAELRTELQNSKQTTDCYIKELKELGASTNNEKCVKNPNKRPLFKRIKDMFRSTRKKKKKHLKAIAVEKEQSTAMTEVNELSTAMTEMNEQSTAMPEVNEVLFDVSLSDDYVPDETEGRGLRREGSTRSQISFGISFTGRCTSINSLPVVFSSGLFEDLDGIEENDFSRRSRGSRRIGRQRSLPEEIKEQDKDLEPIQITNHPASQEKKEGARVKLKCKAQGEKKVFYQWLKDGTKMRGQNNSTLTMDSVGLCDFGFYSCQVRYADSHGRGVASYPAIVDIAPRDGTRYKYIKELDPYTQEKVETLLTKESCGLGGWRQVAFKYDMEEFHIDYLEGNPEAGKATLTYLRATNPDLTVYEFCKTLKEYDMRRLDIVNVLLDHLTVADS